MKLFPRPALLHRIRPHYEDGRVKVLTGLRRSGKSSLLRLIAEDMREELDRPKEDFFFLDLEDFSLRGFRHPWILHKFVFEKAKIAEKRLTVFLDEVDNVEHWEQVVALLLDENVCDLFVTASSVDPFSEDGASLLGGRTVSFEVTPYSFREYRAVRKQVCPEASEEKLWRDYLLWGGMPDVANCADPAGAGLRLIDIFRSILLRDVTRRLNLRNARALETTIAILVERIGERISLEELSRRLLSERISVSAETLADYVRGASDAFLLAEIEGATPSARPDFVFVPGGISPTTDSGRRFASASTKGTPSRSSKTSSAWSCAAAGGRCTTERRKKDTRTSSPKRRANASPCRSPAFWTRPKPRIVRSRPSTGYGTTFPILSSRSTRFSVRRTVSDTKTCGTGF